MILLVSDYDDTLYIHSHSNKIKMNVKTIKKFRENGNKFVIASARDFISLKEETVKYDIPYDYLICYDGNVIYDNNDKIVYKKYIDKSNIDFIRELMNYELIKEPMIFDEKGFIGGKNHFNITDYVNNKDIDYNRIVALKIVPKNILKVNEIEKYIKNNMHNIMIIKDAIILYINPKNNKAEGINTVKEILKIDNKDIYTIGDNMNDLEMIKQYNGYNMLMSDPRLYKVSKGTCLSVKQLIKKINKK